MIVPMRCKGCIFRERFLTNNTCCARVIYTGQLRPPFNSDGSCPVKDTKSRIVEVSTTGGMTYRIEPPGKKVPKEFLRHYKALKEKKITQKELAEKLGVSRQTVGVWAKIAAERKL